MRSKTQFLPADYLLRKHNLEVYVTEELYRRTPFLEVIKVSMNDTGEYSTVIDSGSVFEDIKEGKMSEAVEAGEAAEFTTVTVQPRKAQLGKTTRYGYTIEWTRQKERLAQFTADINLAVNYTITALKYCLEKTIVSGLVETAGLTPPTLSDWGDDDDIDPLKDFINIRSKFIEDTGVFRATDAYLSNTAHTKLQLYMAGLQRDYSAEEVNVDGTVARNADLSFHGLSKDAIFLDRDNPPGVLEAVVDPDFSTVSGMDGAPTPIINVNRVEEDRAPHRKFMEIWADIGYNSREPKAAMAAQLVRS